MIEGQEEFELEEILQHSPAHKVRSDQNIRYLVKWKGYGPAYNSWEPGRALKQHAPETLSEYWDEIEAAVQTAELSSDTRLAPGSHSQNASGRGRTSGRGRGRATGRARGRSLRPVSKKLKK